MKDQYVIIDTGFFVALHTKNDKYHTHAIQVCEQIKHAKWISTWPVITETCYFFIQKSHTQAILTLINLIEHGPLELLHIEKKHFSRIKTLMLKYQDLPMDLADASLVILSEEINSGDIVSTDQRDFKTYRWKNHQPFRNLLKA